MIQRLMVEYIWIIRIIESYVWLVCVVWMSLYVLNLLNFPKSNMQ